MNLKEMTTKQIVELVGEKRLEIIELVESIKEQTDLDCYGTIIIGVKDEEMNVHAIGGGSGGLLDIAELFNTNDGLMSIANAVCVHNACKGDQHDE